MQTHSVHTSFLVCFRVVKLLTL